MSANGKRIVWPELFPKLLLECHGCIGCRTLYPMWCACGEKLARFTGRADVALGIGEEFLARHQGETCKVTGMTAVLPYTCGRCQESYLPQVEHSIPCIDYWNMRAQHRKTGKDGALLRDAALTHV